MLWAPTQFGPVNREWREWPAEEAIAMGQPFAIQEVAPLLLDLALVYLDTVWPGRAHQGADRRSHGAAAPEPLPNAEL